MKKWIFLKVSWCYDNLNLYKYYRMVVKLSFQTCLWSLEDTFLFMLSLVHAKWLQLVVVLFVNLKKLIPTIWPEAIATSVNMVPKGFCCHFYQSCIVHTISCKPLGTHTSHFSHGVCFGNRRVVHYNFPLTKKIPALIFGSKILTICGIVKKSPKHFYTIIFFLLTVWL